MFQSEKKLVLDYYAALDAATEGELEDACGAFVSDDYFWRGYHPFYEKTSLADVLNSFWKPFKHSFTSLKRRQDVFFAGANSLEDEQKWVVSMGHLMGLFDKPWLGIPPTGKVAFLRYCEFNRVENGKIVETAMYIDIPHIMLQAGLQPFPPMTGAQIIQPGPISHNGLLFNEQQPEEGAKTLAAINAMVNDVRDWQSEISIQDELRRTWHEDMVWWGPTGIGSTYTIDRYAKQHAEPFRQGFKNRSFKGHVCRLAEGEFGGFFGWPNMTLTSSGGFMGMPASDKTIELHIIDIYRRKDDKLQENWIFIDLLHMWMQLGVDVLKRSERYPRT